MIGLVKVDVPNAFVAFIVGVVIVWPEPTVIPPFAVTKPPKVDAPVVLNDGVEIL